MGFKLEKQSFFSSSVRGFGGSAGQELKEKPGITLADNPQAAPSQREEKKVSPLQVLAEEMWEPRDSDSEVLDLKGACTQRKDEIKLPRLDA